MSKVYRFSTEQQLKMTLDEAWDFFSNPANLQAITPDALSFKILTPDLGRMYSGQVIEYKVRPVLNIPVYWMTEITHVSDKQYFVDEQRFGPYSLWHHQHHFTANNNGVMMKDIVHYKLPFWILGDIANSLFVKNKLKEIFDFRKKVIEEKFNH